MRRRARRAGPPTSRGPHPVRPGARPGSPRWPVPDRDDVLLARVAALLGPAEPPPAAVVAAGLAAFRPVARAGDAAPAAGHAARASGSSPTARS